MCLRFIGRLTKPPKKKKTRRLALTDWRGCRWAGPSLFLGNIRDLVGSIRRTLAVYQYLIQSHIRTGVSSDPYSVLISQLRAENEHAL